MFSFLHIHVLCDEERLSPFRASWKSYLGLAHESMPESASLVDLVALLEGDADNAAQRDASDVCKLFLHLVQQSFAAVQAVCYWRNFRRRLVVFK